MQYLHNVLMDMDSVSLCHHLEEAQLQYLTQPMGKSGAVSVREKVKHVQFLIQDFKK